MKRKIVAVALLALISIIIAGCTAPTPTSTSTPTTTPTGAPTTTPTTKPTTTATTAPATTPVSKPTTTVKPLVLAWDHWEPYTPGRPLVTEWWAKEIEKRTGGRVKLDIHWGGSLVKADQVPEAVKKGLIDGGGVVPSYVPQKYPLTTVTELPGGSSKQLVLALAWNELYATTPAIQKEWAEWNTLPLTSQASPSFNMVFKKPAANLEEMKGRKIRTHGTTYPKIMTTLGLIPVSMTTVDVYEALARGVVEGVTHYIESIYRMNYWELAQYYYIADIGGQAGASEAISFDAWKKISPADQKAIEELNKEWPAYLDNFFKKLETDAIKEMSAKVGFKVADLSAADKAKVRAAGLALWDSWANDMEAKGLPGKEVAAKWKSLLEKYEKQVGG